MPELDVKLRRAPRFEGDSGDNRCVPRHYEDDDVVDLTPYVRAIRARWRIVLAAAVLAAAITALITPLVLPKWYRAAAVIRPISTPAIESRIAGVMGGLGGGLGGLGGLAASLGASGNSDAEEYIAILQGFQFSLNLAESHHLSKELLKPGTLQWLLGLKPKDPQWKIYGALQKRFECEYSIKTGNITLYFKAKNRADAETILSYYIEDLHELLRAREVKSASSAIESLEEEARSTPDAVLRAELYDLVAKQVQRKKMADVEADFAFRVLDPPAVSDRPYSPQVLLDSVIVAVLASLFAAFIVASRTGQTPFRDSQALHGISNGEDIAAASNRSPAK